MISEWMKFDFPEKGLSRKALFLVGLSAIC